MGPVLAWICAICVYLCLPVSIYAHPCPSSVPLISYSQNKKKCLWSTTSSMVLPNSHAHCWIGQHGERMLRSSLNPRTSSVWSMGVSLHPLMLPNHCHGRSETSVHTLLFTYLSALMSTTLLCKLLLDLMYGLCWRPNSRRMLHQTVSIFAVTSTMLPMTHQNQSLNSSTLFSLSHTNLLL